MGRLILTGLTKNKKHEFKLRYAQDKNLEKCWVDCSCGYSEELLKFDNYGGIKELETIWDKHIRKRQS